MVWYGTQDKLEYDFVIKPGTTAATVRLKFKGQIWVIHRYDADPLPSNPHAHCLEQNIKLDLSNGNCFRKKKFLFRISEKDLLSIRELANDVYKGNLPPLAIQTKDCEQNEDANEQASS